MKWRRLFLACLACLSWAAAAAAQVVLDGSGLAVTGGAVSTDGSLVLNDLRHNAIPSDLWIGQSNGLLQSCSESGGCTNQGDKGDQIGGMAVFNDRLWIGQYNGSLKSCDSSGVCTDHGVKGGGILEVAVFDGRLWINHAGGALQSCDSSGGCTYHGDKGETIHSMVAFGGKLWIGQSEGGLQSCSGSGSCTPHGDKGAHIMSMAVFEGRLWIGQYDGLLQSCDSSGSCTSHGSLGAPVLAMAVFDGRLWIGQNDGTLRSCDSAGSCTPHGGMGDAIGSMEAFNGRLWIGQYDGLLQSCDSSGSCTPHGDKGDAVSSMALFHPPSLGDAVFARLGGKTGVGTHNPLILLDVVGEKAAGDTLWSSHVAGIENLSTNSDADVLALKVNTAVPGSNNNFITFLNGTGAVGAIQGDGAGGVALASGGADFAEYLPKLREDETLAPGDIVGLFPDGVTRKIEGALRTMVITTCPILVGNRPLPSEGSRFVRVAFAGRTPVKVKGPVNAGDWVLGTEQDDGIGISRDPARITPAELRRVVGMALASFPEEGLKKVVVMVGLSQEQLLGGMLDQQGSDISRLLASHEKTMGLRDRLAILEDRVEDILRPSTNGSSGAGCNTENKKTPLPAEKGDSQ